MTSWDRDGNGNSASKLIALPNFHSLSIFTENFVAIELTPLELKIDRPNFIGLVVLDHARDIIYDFWYNYLKPQFEKKIQLVYVDTDAFLFKTDTADFKADIKDDLLKHFDRSDYPQEMLDKYDYPCVNKKVLGKFKDECNGFPLTQFVGLRPKCYGIEIEKPNRTEVKARMKGVSKSVVKNLDLGPYLHTLRTGERFMAKMRRFNSKKHQITTVEINKVGLTSTDDKRFEIPKDPKRRTLAWGNKDILEIQFVNLMEYDYAAQIESETPQSSDTRKRDSCSEDVNQEVPPKKKRNS